MILESYDEAYGPMLVVDHARVQAVVQKIVMTSGRLMGPVRDVELGSTKI
jgi:hypothetical protein